MHKRKPYTCSICGTEVPDLPMPVLEHQFSHVKRRPRAADRPRSTEAKEAGEEAREHDADRG